MCNPPQDSWLSRFNNEIDAPGVTLKKQFHELYKYPSTIFYESYPWYLACMYFEVILRAKYRQQPIIQINDDPI